MINKYFDTTMEQRAHDIYELLMEQARLDRKEAWFRAKQEANKFWLVYVDNNTTNNELTKSIADNATWIEHELPHIARDKDELADTMTEMVDSIDSWLDEANEELDQLKIQLGNAANSTETSEIVKQIKVLRYNIGVAEALKQVLLEKEVL